MEETWIKEQLAWKSLLWNYGVSQTKFAADNGFNKSQLSQWLNGKQKIGAKNKLCLLIAITRIKIVGIDSIIESARAQIGEQ